MPSPGAKQAQTWHSWSPNDSVVASQPRHSVMGGAPPPPPAAPTPPAPPTLEVVVVSEMTTPPAPTTETLLVLLGEPPALLAVLTVPLFAAAVLATAVCVTGKGPGVVAPWSLPKPPLPELVELSELALPPPALSSAPAPSLSLSVSPQAGASENNPKTPSTEAP